MKSARRKLEVPMPAAIPCTTKRDEYRETCCVFHNCNTKYACIVEAGESTRKRTEGTLIEVMKVILQGEELIHVNHDNLVHKLILMPQAMKIPDAKAAVDKGWENLKRNQHGH